MGCPCRVRLEAVSGSRGRRLWSELRRELLRLEKKYSRYVDDSHWQRLLAGAATPEGVDVDEETGALLDLAQRAWEISGGMFDVSCVPLSRAWDWRRGVVPDPDCLETARALVGWQRVIWEKPHLRLPDVGMSLDLDGLVKEYAADAGAALLRQSGVQHGYLDLGGDLAVIGPRSQGELWRIGVRRPGSASLAEAVIEIGQGGLATSGDYERFMDVGGRRYSHLLNPCTARPASGLQSVSVAAEHCTSAGIAATTGMLKGRRDAGPWLRRMGLPHLIIDNHGEVTGTLARRWDPGQHLMTFRDMSAGSTYDL